MTTLQIELPTELRPRMRKLREVAGLSQTEMGQIIGVSLRTVQNWESPSHEQAIPVDKFMAWCAACGVDPGAMLEGLVTRQYLDGDGDLIIDLTLAAA